MPSTMFVRQRLGGLRSASGRFSSSSTSNSVRLESQACRRCSTIRLHSAGLVRDGHAEILRAETAAGMRFAFHDGGVARDHVIEICEREPGVQNFYDMVRDASIGWDGSDPVRTL
jgi:hypothetical protein